MGFYVYGVVPALHETPAISGIDGSTVSLFVLDELAALVSEAQARPEASVERIRRHNQVVLGAMTPAIMPVPIRFGQFFESETALREALGRRAAEFSKLLADFAGASEYGLRVADPELVQAPTPEQMPVQSGREYLIAIQQRMRAQQPLLAVEAQVREACAPHVRAERVERSQTGAGMLSITHLVAHTQTEAYRECVHQLRESLPGLRFLVSGPWPPYSFAA